jgi:methylated-DNA-[protein]-cysteine S-methyltransferase
MIHKFFSAMPTPLGKLGIFADAKAIYRVEFIDRVKACDLADSKIGKENDLTLMAKKQLEQYFCGETTEFNLPLAPQGTPFRQQTWQALQKIPYGEIRYYSQQAELMNNKKAVRAVGAANGANPIAIIIPCHRVIGKNGSLTGYAGGLDRKAWLLNFEQKEQQNKQVFILE